MGIWSAGLDQDGELFCNQRYGDWPLVMPDGKADPWAQPEWYLLSFGKNVRASSETEGHAPSCAADENVQTWRQAASADEEEWLELDLRQTYDVRTVQINFADLTLMLMYLTSWEKSLVPGLRKKPDRDGIYPKARFCWKGYDFGILSELTDEGLVNAGGCGKSASFNAKGETKARELLKAYEIEFDTSE